MSNAELIDRLTDLVKLQADIIHEQADALAQLNAVTSAEHKMKLAEMKLQAIK